MEKQGPPHLEPAGGGGWGGSAGHLGRPSGGKLRPNNILPSPKFFLPMLLPQPLRDPEGAPWESGSRD